MRPHDVFLLLRKKLSAIHAALLLLLIILCGSGIASSTAQAPVEEREVENTIPR